MQSDRWSTTGTALHGLTIAGGLFAAAAFGIAEADGTAAPARIATSLALQAVAAGLAAVVARRLARQRVGRRGVAALILAVASIACVWEPASRHLFGVGRPLELLLMCCFRNLALALAAASCWRAYQRLAWLASLFLSLFAMSITSATAVHFLAGAYTLAGISWLCAAHWEGLRGGLVSADEARFGRRRFLSVFALAAVSLVALGSTENALVTGLRGFIPSSGGDGRYDPFARSGVGDGDALVAGTDDIRSFAPIEEAPFLSSDQPSLYDVFNETYDEPMRPKNQDRTIALPPELAREIEQRLAVSQRANREFSTLRKQGRRARKQVGDLNSDALFYVAGRTPLHLRLELFDLFDGLRWHAEPLPRHPRPLRLAEQQGRMWVEHDSTIPMFEFFSEPEVHTLKVVGLDTNCIPMPSHAVAVHIDQADRLDLFDWAQDGILRLQRAKLPPLVPISLQSHTVDGERLRQTASMLVWSGREPHRQVPASFYMEQVAALAEAWTQGIPRGLAQVDAICKKLRTDYVLDAAARPPADCVFPVGHFLFTSRRGPDYQFATAAALMLRSLGYSTRLVSGFYARPDKYDPRSRHTPVHKDDVHFWAEVHLGAGTWITVEPTPGYEILGPPPDLWDRFVAGLFAAATFIRRHAAGLLATAALACCVFLVRYRLLDLAGIAAWRLARWRSERQAVLGTVRLLERRGRWAGHVRPRDFTASRWLRSMCGTAEATPDWETFLSLADWAAFAPEHATPTADQVRRISAAALAHATLSRLIQRSTRKRRRLYDISLKPLRTFVAEPLNILTRSRNAQ